MKRNEFLRNVTAASIALALPTCIIGSSNDKSGSSVEAINTIEDPLQHYNLTSYKHVSDKYLSAAVKNFRHYRLNTVIPERPDLTLRYLGFTIDAYEKVPAFLVKKFCEKINECERRGLIEYAATTDGVYGIRLFSVDRHLLLYYAFSKFTLAELKLKSADIFPNQLKQLHPQS